MKNHTAVIVLVFAAVAHEAFAASLCVSAPGKVCHDAPASHGDTVQLMEPPASQASCTVPGTWTTLYGNVTVNSDLSGTYAVPYCPQPFSLTVTLEGPAAFSVRAVWSGEPGACQSFTEGMAFTSTDCVTATGPYVNDDGTRGTDTWTRTSCSNTGRGDPCQPQINLSRRDLMTVVATGTPVGGSFSYSSSTVSGGSVATIQYATGVSPQDNPNTAALADPQNPDPLGSPSQGGLLNVNATYATSDSAKANKTFQVPTFGISCYYTALETDWGSPPNACESVTISGKRYTGAETNPLGLPGTYCRAFIGQVMLQGSGVTADSRKVQFNPSSRRIAVVTEIVVGPHHVPVVVGNTIARDPRVIPYGVLVDVDRVGVGLQAIDTGDKKRIHDYRIDVYEGAGAAVCAHYNNVISVSACNPGSARCPASQLE